MKVLMIAANPDVSSTLGLEREISALQRKFLDYSLNPAEFIPLPDLRAEELGRLRTLELDILHISAHGDTSHLLWSNSTGSEIKVHASHLASFINADHPPKVIYFNGCKTSQVAELCLETVSMAIGTPNTISNGQARAIALVFYEAILCGASVAEAFTLAASMGDMLDGLRIILHKKEGARPETETLRPKPRLIAKFERVRQDNDGAFAAFVGIRHCPSSATQLVAFSDSGTVAPVSTAPTWDAETAWLSKALRVRSDARLFVTCILRGSATFVVEAILSDALENPEQTDNLFAINLLRKLSKLR